MTAPSWLGIDLGGTFIKWEHLTDDGSTLASGRVATPRTGEQAVTDAVSRLIAEGLQSPQVPAGVGIAVPGHLTAGRDSITLLPNVPGTWLGYPFAAEIRSATGMSPVLMNDARSFATAELELGAARGHSDVVFATIGTGIGGAVAVDGRVVSSARDAFGEIGHTTAVIDGLRCGCGSAGCVEAYAGGAAVLSRAELRGVPIAPGPGALAALAARTDSDPVAARVLEEAYRAFAVAVSSMCAFSGASLVVIGGAVARELPGYVQRSRAHLAGRRQLLGDVEVRQALLGARAGAVGAAVAARSGGTQTFTELEFQA